MKHTDNEMEYDIDDFNEYLSEGDLIFIVDKKGILRTVLIPDEFEFDSDSVPLNLKKVFKIFGIKKLSNHTVH